MTTEPRSRTTLAHLGQLADHHFARHGDYDFVFFESAWHSSGTLLERARRIAGGLVQRGLEPGERVIVSMPNTPEVPVLYNAIWRAGGVVTPAMFLLSPPELRHVVQDSGARFLFTTRDLLETVTEATEGIDQAPEIICVESASGAFSLQELESSEAADVVDRTSNDLAALLYTGGTTGRAKGVMLSHQNLIYAAEAGSAYEAQLDLTRELVALPLSHSFGLLATIGALTSTVPKVWVMPRRFVPKTVVSLLEEHRISVLQAVPSMLQMLLAEPLEELDLSDWRVVFSGGASLAPEVIAEFGRRVPSLSILEGYGLTETSTLLTANPFGAAKVGSVGTALPGVEIRIVDAEGEDVPPGEAGEIITRSPSVMMSYWNAPDATAATLQDGWLATGDVGRLDPDGYLFILDRKKDLIIRGGFNVFPRDIEDALLEHPSIQMAAVIGRPDTVHGEEIVAFVGLKEGELVTPEELTTWAKHRLGAYKRPREFHVVDAIPLTDVGKINRKALRARLTDDAR